MIEAIFKNYLLCNMTWESVEVWLRMCPMGPDVGGARWIGLGGMVGGRTSLGADVGGYKAQCHFNSSLLSLLPVCGMQMELSTLSVAMSPSCCHHSLP